MSDKHIVTGTGASTTLLASPVADALAGTVYTDVVSMENYEKAYFQLSIGVGATGTATLTVESCDDFTPTTTQAIPFEYKRTSSGETNTAWTKATASGFTTTAGSHQVYTVRVRAENVYDNYPNVRLKSVEVVDSPVLAGCTISMESPRYNAEQMPAVTA